ncbi:MAG: MFS transporter [Defluviicoccus sp.]|nr:MFS transporter [Defluviicoccus sp.]MDE0385153.1 MFS transporter [Defluviicoccus sp.]
MTGPSALRVWAIVALCFCALGLTFASRSSVGVLMPIWEVELGWSRGLSSTGSSLVLVIMGLISPIAGDIIDRVGPRHVFAGGLVFMGGAIAASSQISHEWQFLLLFGVIGGVGHGAISLPLVTAMMAQLLRRHSGVLTGFALSGSTAGQLPVLTLLALLVVALGWRGAYLSFGLGLLALIPLAWLLLKGVGREPRGRAQGDADAATFVARLGILTRNRSFVLLSCSFVLCGFTTAGVFDVHFVPYAVSCGFALVDSTAAHGAHGAGNMIGLILFGWLSDRLHRARLLAAMYAARALLFVLLLNTTGSLTLLFVFTVAFGILNFATLAPIASLIASHVGIRMMGLSMGLIFGVHSIGAALGAAFGGYFYDLTARYEGVWLISLGLALLAAALALLVREEPDENRPRMGVPLPAPA